MEKPQLAGMRHRDAESQCEVAVSIFNSELQKYIFIKSLIHLGPPPRLPPNPFLALLPPSPPRPTSYPSNPSGTLGDSFFITCLLSPGLRYFLGQ